MNAEIPPTTTGEEYCFSFAGEGDEAMFERLRQLQLAQLGYPPVGGAAITSNSTGSSSVSPPPPRPPAKKKRNLPGNPDPAAEVVALSPETLMATNRFVCEICGKGFRREQNVQLHRRGHNLPWKLRQRATAEVRKKVYVCPETSCVHHDPRRALGDLTGIKKHFCRKHGEKKWKCGRCSKKYAVQSDLKAHSKTCGTREYKCGCGVVFSRRDSFVTHRAFCDALAEENRRSAGVDGAVANMAAISSHGKIVQAPDPLAPGGADVDTDTTMAALISDIDGGGKSINPILARSEEGRPFSSGDQGSLLGQKSWALPYASAGALRRLGGGGGGLDTLPGAGDVVKTVAGPTARSAAHMSATALLQKASLVGATAGGRTNFLPADQGAPLASAMACPDGASETRLYTALQPLVSPEQLPRQGGPAQLGGVGGVLGHQFLSPVTAGWEWGGGGFDGGFPAAATGVQYEGNLQKGHYCFRNVENQMRPAARNSVLCNGKPPAAAAAMMAGVGVDEGRSTVDFLGLEESKPPPSASAAPEARRGTELGFPDQQKKFQRLLATRRF